MGGKVGRSVAKQGDGWLSSEMGGYVSSAPACWVRKQTSKIIKWAP
jgi:hypothetical protein